MHLCIDCRQASMKSTKPAMSAEAWPRVIPFQREQKRRGEELAFLPAALEIAETPPSPIGRAIGATLILLFCAALVWAWLGAIDIVASATGKIVPSGSTKVIQPFETGVVRSIRVHDGQAVKMGDVLMADFKPPADADAALINTQRHLLLNQVVEHRAKIAALARQQAQKEAEQTTIGA